MSVVFVVVAFIVIGIVTFIVITHNSVRDDNRSNRLSAPIWAICRYIGFADKQNAYRHRLSVSADKDPYIGNLSDMLNYIWPLGGW